MLRIILKLLKRLNIISQDILIREEEQSYSRYKRKLKPIWQKRYYEHTIRNEKDYVRCLEYMRDNPLKHGYIANGEVWEYMPMLGAVATAPLKSII